MSVRVPAESEVIREATEILLQHLTPAKAARFWASWHRGEGDYIRWREEEFASETVDTLYTKVEAFQRKQTSVDDKRYKTKE